MAVVIPPIAMPTAPNTLGGTPERSISAASVIFCYCSNADGGGILGRIAPKVIRPNPAISRIIQLIILRTAMIITPVGRNFAVCNCNFIQLSYQLSNTNRLGKVIRIYYKFKKYNIYLIKYYTHIVGF